MSSTGQPGRGLDVVDHPGIVTPDAVGLDLQIATLGSRGAAYLFDLSVFGAVSLLLVLGQATLGVGGFVPGWLGIAALLLLAFLWQFGYPICFEVLARGRTPGKAVLGLRVLTVEGAPVGLRHATIRATVGLLELIGTGGAVAVLSSFASPRSQRLGDLAAGTLVVRERGGGAPTAESFVPPPGLEAYAARLDVSGLRTSDYAILRETLRRVRELSPQVRARRTADLARRLVGDVRPPPPQGCSAEAFLTCVAAAVQARRARPLGNVSAARDVRGGHPVVPSYAPDAQPSPARPPEHPGSGFAPPT